MRETAEMLVQYSQYLKVDEKPCELIKILHEKGDIIVFTRAKENYAKKNLPFL